VRIKSSATLVVCPASLVHQWEKEIQRRVKHGTLDVVVYHGPNRISSPERYVCVCAVTFTVYLTAYIGV